MKKFLCLLLSISLILVFFVSCSNTDNDDVEIKYSITYYGVLDGEKIELPTKAYLDGVSYPKEYVKGKITQIDVLKRYYNDLKDGVNYDISFEGWYSDENCTQSFSFISKTATGDLTLYAKLTSREIRARSSLTYKAVINNKIAEIPSEMFNTNGLYPNNYYEGDEIAISDLIKEYQPNVYSVYEFIKWYTTSDCDEEFTGITTSTTGNITLYAKIIYSFWTPNA